MRAGVCRMDPDRAAAFAEDLLDEEKLKDMTAADGTLPGGAREHACCMIFRVVARSAVSFAPCVATWLPLGLQKPPGYCLASLLRA